LLLLLLMQRPRTAAAPTAPGESHAALD
jgi:hypothetical protein